MALRIFDRVKQVTSSTGTGNITLGGTPNGFQSFSDVFSSGDTTYICIENGANWEVSRATYGVAGSGTLSRDTILDSSTGAAINLSGRSTVFCTVPAAKYAYLDPSGEINLSLGGLSDATITSPATGNILSYNGSQWVNSVPDPGYNDEQAQDAIGSILGSGTDIVLSYNDSTPAITGTLTNTTVTPGSYTLASITVDQKGRISAASSGSVDLSSYLTSATAASTYVALGGSYSDPTWITGLAWSKLSGLPSAVSSLSGVNTGDQDLSSYATTVAVAATYLPLAGGTLTGDLKFTDATYDIGKSGATRPRDGFFSRNLTVGNTFKFRVDMNSAIATGVTIQKFNTLRFLNEAGNAWITTSHLNLNSGSYIAFGSNGGESETTVLQGNDASDMLFQRRSTNAQTFRLAETYTSATSFGALQIKANAGAAYQIGSAIGSAGGSNRAVELGQWSSAGTFTSLLSLDTANSRIGIGRTNPTTTFEVYGNPTGGTTVGDFVVDSTNKTVYVGRQSSTSSDATDFVVRGRTGVGQFGILQNSNIGYFNSLGGSNWKFGIGTASPSATMHVVGDVLIAQNVSTSGSPTALTLTGAAHTTLAASTEATDVNFNLSSTKQFATGALTTQRAMRIQAPTYSFVGASTITTASTLSISGPPAAGTNATITNPWALNVESGNVRVGGSIIFPASGTGVRHIGEASSPNGGGWRFTGDNIEAVYAGSSYFTLALASTHLLRDQIRFYTVWGGYTPVTVRHGSSPTVEMQRWENSAGALQSAVTATGGFLTNDVVIRNGTTATQLDVNNTYTSSTSFETFRVKANAGAAYQIGSAIGSAGGTNRAIQFGHSSSGGTFTDHFVIGVSDGIQVGGSGGSNNYIQLRGDRASWGEYGIAYSVGLGATLLYAYNNGSPIQLGHMAYGRASFSAKFVIDGNGNSVFTPAVQTSGSPTAFTITDAAHTTMTASTEATSVNLNLSSTKQFATGAISTQRAMRIQAPTYSFVGASTITTASTLAISGAPAAGTNATITNAYALNIESGKSYFADHIHIPSGKYIGTSSGYGFGVSNTGANVLPSIYYNGFAVFEFGGGIFQATTALGIGVTLGGYNATGADTLWYRDSAGVFAQRNSTNAQTLRVYTTYTSSTSYETINIKGKAAANFEIGPENGSAGGTLRGLTIGGYSGGSSTITPWLTLTNAGAATFASTITASDSITTNGLFSSDRYAVSANYRFRRANGTSASPSQVLINQAVGALSSFGYHDTGAFHTSAGAIMYFVAAENYASGAQGTNIQFWTTPTTSTTSAKRLCIEASGELTLEAGSHIQTSGAGIKLGTATSQKFGFWNATPVVQQTTASTSATVVGGGGTTVTQTDTFDGYTLAQIVKALRTIGILA